MSILLVGVLSSVATEVVTWINKKLSGTVLTGDGAFFLATGIALVAAAVKVYMSGTPVTDVGTLWASFAQVWAVSQVFFLVIVQTLGLDVKSSPKTPVSSTTLAQG